MHVFRDPADCEAIAAAARVARRAAVIGGGLLGLEAARGIVAHGCPVTVVHLMDRLMERQLDRGAADLLAPAMAALGVDVLLERATEAIEGDGRAERLRFAGGDVLDVDLVVIAIGIRPQVDLARATGLAVERAIVVDDRLVSSHPRVLAVGECAQHRGVVHGIVAPIQDQAVVAAATLVEPDAELSYAGSVPSAKLKVAGVDLVAAGTADGERAAVVADETAGSYRKLVVEQGRAAGLVLLGDTRGFELLLDAVRGRAEVSDPLALLAQASQATAADLPDTAQVCNCNGVCKGAIVQAIRDRGLGSTAEVGPLR